MIHDCVSLNCAGAVALENLFPYTNHRFVNSEFRCSGLESNITDCTQNIDEASSCLSLGVASVTCYCKNTLHGRIFPTPAYSDIYSVHTSIPQMEHSPTHPALMVRYDSATGTSKERAGWRSASTMPGALCVTMDGTMRMLQWSAGS